MQFFSRNCTHILTRTQGGKFEYMFFVKIARKGTSLMSKQTNNTIHFFFIFSIMDFHPVLCCPSSHLRFVLTRI